LKKGYSYHDIAPEIGKSASAISREVKKNSTKGNYFPIKAEYKARLKRRMSKYQGMKVAERPWLEKYIADKMKNEGWTPEEISGRLKRENGDRNIISAKSIYKFLYSNRGQYLCKYLPHQRYKPQKRRGKRPKKSNIPNRKSISERPVVADLNIQFGHFEGDTLGRIKIDNEVIPGVREKMSRKLFLCKMPRLKYAMDGFNQMLSPHHDIIESFTLDNGVENVRYEELNIPTYFCDAYASWQKGGIENDFMRLRRWIPKKASLSNYSNQDIHDIMNKMNNTPRKCLNWKTPNEEWNELYGVKTNLTSVALEGKI
jgi:IS30 family transposase